MGTGTRTGTGTSASSPRASSPRASSRSVSVSDHPSSAGRSVLPARVAGEGDVDAPFARRRESSRRVDSRRVIDGRSFARRFQFRRFQFRRTSNSRLGGDDSRRARDSSHGGGSRGDSRGDPRRGSRRGSLTRVHRGSVFHRDVSRASRGGEGGRSPFPRVVSAKGGRDARRSRRRTRRRKPGGDVAAARETFGRRRRSPRRPQKRRDKRQFLGEFRDDGAWRIADPWRIRVENRRRRGADRLARVVGSSDGSRGTLLHHLARTVGRNPALSCVSRRTRRHSRRRRRARRRRGSTPTSIVSTRRRERRRGNGRRARIPTGTTRTRRSRDRSAIRVRDAARDVAEVRSLSREAGEAAARLMERFGPAPRGATSEDALRALAEFAEAFGKAARENAQHAQHAEHAENAEHAEAEGGGNEDEEA